MTMRVKRPIHWIALCIGVIAAAVEGLSNVEDIAHKIGYYNDPAVFAAAITSIGAAVLLAFTIKAINQKHFFVASGLFVTLIATAGYTMSTTLNRTADARQKALSKIYEADAQYQQLSKLYKSVSERTAWECGQGAGPKCQNNKDAMIKARSDLILRENSLDAMGNQVQWMLSTIGVRMDVDTAGKIQPLFLPISLFLLGMMCIAFGENGEYVEPEFDTTLTGNAAVEDKVKRFIIQYRTVNGTTPPVSQILKVADIKEWKARTLLKKHG